MRKVSPARIEELLQDYGPEIWLAMQSGGVGRFGIGIRTACKIMHCSSDTATQVLEMLQQHQGVPSAARVIGEATEEAMPVYTDEELIQSKIDRYRRMVDRERVARMSRRMWLPNDLPVGILHIGDPHLDDDGCDLELLRAHLALVRSTAGLFAGCLGDLSNNWVGKLLRLWAEQHTDKADEKQLIGWFFKQTPLLYFMAGNHDLWNEGYQHLRAAIREATRTLGRQAVVYLGSTELEMTILAPNGRSWVVRCRHNFKGNSQWNPTHAMTKDAMFRPGADVLVQGHRHNLAIQSRTLPSGQYVTAIQVSAYKRFDSYAAAHQFPEHEGGEAVLTILQPLGDSAQARTLTYADPFTGAQALSAMRREAIGQLLKQGNIEEAEAIELMKAEEFK